MPITRNPRDDMQAALYDDGHPSADEYEFEPGVCILPIAEEPPTDPVKLVGWSPVVKLHLHAPYRIRHSQVRARKTNNPPIVPAPQDKGKFVFVGGTLHVENAMNTSLNTFDWYVQTDYTFVENCPSRIEDGFVLTGKPWTWQTSIANGSGGIASIPPIGAISQAGQDAKIGYTQGLSILISAGLELFGMQVKWAYNTCSFFPGTFMNTETINGGPIQLVSG